MALLRASAEQCNVPPTTAVLTDGQASELAARFAALADPARVRIVHRLLGAREAPVCVCDLVALLRLSQPAVSYHLKILRDAGIVHRERRGSFAHYRLTEGALERLLAPLWGGEGSPNAAGGRASHALVSPAVDQRSSQQPHPKRPVT
jgi:ArsR family transcriptional regulator